MLPVTSDSLPPVPAGPIVAWLSEPSWRGEFGTLARIGRLWRANLRSRHAPGPSRTGRRTRSPCGGETRKGLSTLEMVLVLPILLFVMALIINFGTVASWKVRGLVVARNEVWSNRMGRSGFPKPWYWQKSAGATAGHGGGADLPTLDRPMPSQEVVRGPLPKFTLRPDDPFDPSQGITDGTSDLNRKFTLLARLGRYHLHSENRVLDRAWQHPEIGTPPWRRDAHTCLRCSPAFRRIPLLYGLPTPDASLVNAYRVAAIALYLTSFRQDLYPLDWDDEFRSYSRRFHWPEEWEWSPPDFHPMPNQFCSLDDDRARQSVDALIDRIKNVPKTMVHAWINQQTVPNQPPETGSHPQGLYPRVIYELQRMIDRLQGMIDAAKRQKSPPWGQIAAWQAQIDAARAEIAELQKKIDILEQYLKTLP